MPKSAAEYETEIEELKAQLARLQEGVRLTMTGGRSAPAQGVSTTAGTVSGVEEMVVQIGADKTIRYLNGPMAKLLGVADRTKAIGAKLVTIDHGILGNGALASVSDSANSIGAQVEVERLFPGLSAERLPDLGTARPASDPILRFVATPTKNSVTVVVQDVTRLRWLESTFARYVPPSVITQMLQRSQNDFMATERRVITMLYVDLRGFTRISQEMNVSDLSTLTNEYLSAMVLAVTEHEGTVDKFVGDEVVALFGAPMPRPDHALKALMTAGSMLARHRTLLENWRARGWPQPEIGIGVSTGEVVVGNVGTATRVDYTALGHWMNLGARLCGDAQPGEILTIAETYRQALEAAKIAIGPIPRFKFESAGKKTFKNVEIPLEVLRVRVPS
jgi:class 3 adenylate cyclase